MRPGKDGPPNLIQPAQYAPWFGTEPMPQMALACYALERYRIPDENQAKLDPLRPQDAPRFWWLAKGQKYPVQSGGRLPEETTGVKVRISVHLCMRKGDMGPRAETVEV